MRHLRSVLLQSTIMAAVVLLAGQSAGAQQPHHGHDHEPASFPHITLDAEIEVETRKTYKSQSDGAKVRDSYFDTDFEFGLHLDDWVSAIAHIKLEPVRGQAASENRAFEDHGLYFEELYLNLQRDGWRAYFGKYNPGFGIGYDSSPTIYDDDFTSDYEITEGIGAGFAYSYGSEGSGIHTIGAGVFFQDNSLLSTSVMSHPKPSDRRFIAGEKSIDRFGRNRHRYGGVSNTRGPTSFFLHLDGAELPFAPGLAYHVGFARLDEGRFTGRPEYRTAIGATYDWQIDDDWSFSPIVEWVYRRNVDGNPKADIDFQAGSDELGNPVVVTRRVSLRQNAHYLTTGFELGWREWAIGFLSVGRHLQEGGNRPGPNGRDVNERLNAVTLSYRFDFGLGLHAGWKRERLFDADRGEKVTGDTYGFQLSYEFSWER